MVAIEGIILAGGTSSRMGRNKALLPFAGKTLIEHIIDSLRPYCWPIHVVTSKRNYDEFTFLQDIILTTDLYHEKGPLAGIHAGLKNISTNYGFVMACDMPIFSPHLFVQLKKELKNQDAILCPGQPFHALYHKRILEVLENCIHQQDLKMSNMLHQINTHSVEPEDSSCFLNLNAPHDYHLFLKKK